MMLTADYSFQFIDWWHDPVENEPFKHEGNLSTHMLNLRFSLGFDDYWDMTIEQPFIKRCMDWHRNESSDHHRTECSDTDFYDDDGNLQARGGILGDTQFKVRYLVENVGKGLGNRFFIQGGLVIPSNYTLLSDPFFLKEKYEGTYDESDSHSHRHFAISEGTYKASFGLEFFQKRATYPIFWGITSKVYYPLKENDYGFLSSVNYDFSLFLLSGPPLSLDMKSESFQLNSIGLGLNIKHSDFSEWDGFEVPNSKSTAVTPMLTFTFSSLNRGSFGFSLNTSNVSTFIAGDDVLDGDTQIWGLSFSYRKSLNKIVDSLYWN
ncbi:MAG: hypothetical protein CMG64_05450 [Candidatus Marinimicrobia bacterium]|nr:hypothetical protein [Candidatus Neomarinimicrobiota bacterium]|tara:strand:- start:4810 stop:5772 length:963 start_codon:yes stop_codon:yes gene_type:complete